MGRSSSRKPAAIDTTTGTSGPGPVDGLAPDEAIPGAELPGEAEPKAIAPAPAPDPTAASEDQAEPPVMAPQATADGDGAEVAELMGLMDTQGELRALVRQREESVRAAEAAQLAILQEAGRLQSKIGKLETTIIVHTARRLELLGRHASDPRIVAKAASLGLDLTRRR